MKIKLNRSLFFFIVLLLSFMHAVLRANSESSFSLYRLLLPLSLILIFLSNTKKAIPYFILLIILILYNFILTFFYCNIYTHFAVMALHYISIFNIFLLIDYLYNKNGFTSLYKFLKAFFFLSIFVAILEYLFKFRLPNTAIYFDGSVSAFNWNQNELGTSLLAFFIIYLVVEKNHLFKFIVICTYFWLNFINDAKMVLLASIFGLFLYLFKVTLPKQIKLVINTIGVILLFSLFLLPYNDMIISFRDYDISLNELIVHPIVKIFTLDPFVDNGGSIVTRVNAIIYAITEWGNSYLFGIGIGNTLIMMEKPEYHLISAKSIHNLPIQLLVENGLIVLFFYFLIFRYFLRAMVNSLNKHNLLAYVAIPTFFLGSMGSSVGIFSDYYFMACLFFVYFILKKRELYES